MTHERAPDRTNYLSAGRAVRLAQAGSDPMRGTGEPLDGEPRPLLFGALSATGNTYRKGSAMTDRVCSECGRGVGQYLPAFAAGIVWMHNDGTEQAACANARGDRQWYPRVVGEAMPRTAHDVLPGETFGESGAASPVLLAGMFLAAAAAYVAGHVVVLLLRGIGGGL